MKLLRYFQFAQDNLGIANAIQYKDLLHQKKYGPDILHLVDDTEPKKIRIPAGHVLWLKSGALPWWNGPDVKRKWSENDMGSV